MAWVRREVVMGALIAPSWERNLIAKALRGVLLYHYGSKQPPMYLSILEKHYLLFCNFALVRSHWLILFVFPRLAAYMCSLRLIIFFLQIFVQLKFPQLNIVIYFRLMNVLWQCSPCQSPHRPTCMKAGLACIPQTLQHGCALFPWVRMLLQRFSFCVGMCLTY